MTISPNTAASQRDSADRARAAAQANKILAMPVEAGGLGYTNSQLWTICHAANSRISDLRKRGHKIEAVSEGAGVWRYRLTARPGNSRFEQKYRQELQRAAPLFAWTEALNV
jgi:hypothetical protein